MINLVELVERETEKRIKRISNPEINMASEIGWVDDCRLYLVLRRLCPEKEILHDVPKQRIFDEGRRQEQLISQELLDAGVKLHKAEHPFLWPEYRIQGDIDSIIEINGDLFPIEFKSCGGGMARHLFKCKTQEDLLASRFWWARHYPAQLQIYILLIRGFLKKPLDEGILYFKNRDQGNKHQIDVHVDEKYCAHLLHEVKIVNEIVDKKFGIEPEYKDICKNCGFCYSFCFPEMESEEVSGDHQVKRIVDPELEMRVSRWFELKPAHQEWEKLDTELNSEVQGQELVVGDYHISSKEFFRSGYSIPPEIKEKYKTQIAYFRKTIRNLISAIK